MTKESLEKATFAGGCFWCMVKPFDTQPGIEKVISGYTGGHTVNPTYKEVCSGTTGHTEAIQITFDPAVFPYEKLVEVYWQQTDPTDAAGQFVDRGDSYRPVIFYHNEEQKKLLKNQKQPLMRVVDLKSRLSQKLPKQKHFILLKNIIKIFTRKKKRTMRDIKLLQVVLHS